MRGREFLEKKISFDTFPAEDGGKSKESEDGGKSKESEDDGKSFLIFILFCSLRRPRRRDLINSPPRTAAEQV
jgi:hypothetical protein